MIGMESSVGLAFFLRNLGALCISVMEFRSKDELTAELPSTPGRRRVFIRRPLQRGTRCVDNPVGVRNTRPRLLT